MTAILHTRDWLDVIHHDYLGDFIPAGGAAVKFAVACDGTPTAELAKLVADAAAADGFFVARLSAAEVRVHMIDKAFHAVAAQTPWADLAAERLALLAEGSFTLPPALGPGAVDQQIAGVSGGDAEYVRMVLNQKIAEEVFKDHELARDFRIAMTWLCRARLNGGSEGETQQAAITEWLTGQIPAISNMKQYQIYTKINRTNARHQFESLFTWVRRCGRPGTVLVIDGGRLTEAKPERDGSVAYTKSALLDAYEVFRQFIDGTDQLNSALMVVIADEGFLDTEPGSRGLGAYSALMNRVFDEVHDRNFANPMSSLLRLTTEDRT